MRIHILGSSAGKTVPRPFCRCRVCEVARQVGGRHVRTRCAVHLYPGDATGEPRYAVDLSPDVWYHLIRDCVVLDGLEHLLVSHAHADHLDRLLVGRRGSILSDQAALPHLNIYGSDSVGEQIAGLKLDTLNASWHQLEPFEPFTAGELNILPLLGNHGSGTVLNHVVQHGEQSLLLAWDTGYWQEKSWEAVANFRFAGVISECTMILPQESGDPQAGILDSVCCSN
jgi:phosphoribosyl 1,2-cyclic phosphate phosphodiesterase